MRSYFTLIETMRNGAMTLISILDLRTMAFFKKIVCMRTPFHFFLTSHMHTCTKPFLPFSSLRCPHMHAETLHSRKKENFVCKVFPF